MLLSIALILLLGMMMGWICKKAHLPGLIGMLITGIMLGPYALNLRCLHFGDFGRSSERLH